MPVLGTTAFIVGSTAVTWATVVQTAITIYGIYESQEQARKQKKAADDKLKDRTVGPGGTDAPRTTVYGRREVNGRIVFIKEAKDESPKFYLVKALSCGHEIDAFEEILFDGKPIGPYTGDLNVEGGMVEMAPGSPFYELKTATEVLVGTCPASGVITAKGPVVKVTQYQNTSTSQPPASDFSYMSRGDEPSGFIGDNGVPPTFPQQAIQSISGNTITVAPQYRGLGYTMTYEYELSKGYVRLWCYRGTMTQAADPFLQWVDARWNSNCRGTNVPYIIVEITPDLDKFPSGMPDVSAIVRGKRCFDPRTNQTVWTRNPTLHILDHVNTETDSVVADWDAGLLVAAANNCDEAVILTDGGGIMQGPTSEPRYSCDIEVSSDVDPIENVRVMLATMAGSLTPGGPTIDIRAGVAQTPVGELTDDDLADENWSVQPFTAALELFNSVRGRYTAYDPVAKTFTTTDFPPYASPFYREQDAGIPFWSSFDLPAVQSITQAVRISKLELHRQRNALVFKGTFKLNAMQFSVGQVVNLTMQCLGQAAKPYEIIARVLTEDDRVELTLREQANGIYAWTYREGVDPDPSPNTELPDPFFVPAITGLQAESGKEVAVYGANGTVRPVMRVRWDQLDDINTLYGGHIDLWYKSNTQLEFTKVQLPSDAARFDVKDVIRGQQFHVQVRAVNAIQTRGKWAVISHEATDTPTSYITGNLIVNAELVLNPNAKSPQTTPEEAQFIGWDDRDAFFPPSGFTPPGPAALILAGNELGKPTGAAAAFYQGSAFNPVPLGSLTRYYSRPVAVKPGERMLAFAQALGQRATVYVGISYLNSSMQRIAQGPLSPASATEATVSASLVSRTVTQKPIHIFDRVPANAAFAQFMVLYQTNVDNQLSQICFYHPWMSRASEGQVTLPPWSS